jgi:hypothetical protein
MVPDMAMEVYVALAVLYAIFAVGTNIGIFLADSNEQTTATTMLMLASFWATILHTGLAGETISSLAVLFVWGLFLFYWWLKNQEKEDKTISPEDLQSDIDYLKSQPFTRAVGKPPKKPLGRYFRLDGSFNRCRAT